MLKKKDKVVDAKFTELDENGNPIEKPEEEKTGKEFGAMVKSGAKKVGKIVLKGVGIGLGAVVTTFVALKISAPRTRWIDIPLKDASDADVSDVAAKFDEAFDAAKDAGMEVKEF